MEPVLCGIKVKNVWGCDSFETLVGALGWTTNQSIWSMLMIDSNFNSEITGHDYCTTAIIARSVYGFLCKLHWS